MDTAGLGTQQGQATSNSFIAPVRKRECSNRWLRFVNGRRIGKLLVSMKIMRFPASSRSSASGAIAKDTVRQDSGIDGVAGLRLRISSKHLVFSRTLPEPVILAVGAC